MRRCSALLRHCSASRTGCALPSRAQARWPSNLKMKASVPNPSPVDVFVRDLGAYRCVSEQYSPSQRIRIRSPSLPLPNMEDLIQEVQAVESEVDMSGLRASRRRPSRELPQAQNCAPQTVQPRAPRIRPSREELDVPELGLPAPPTRAPSSISEVVMDEQAWLAAAPVGTPVSS